MTSRLGIALTLVCLASLAHARLPGSVGPCQDGGQLQVIKSGEFAGEARSALANPAFAKPHKRYAGEEPPWLAELSGRSAPNRVYVLGNKEVLMTTVCDVADCKGARAYVAFDMRQGHWGATVIEGQALREIFAGAQTTLAMHQASIQSALQCAIQLDLQD